MISSAVPRCVKSKWRCSGGQRSGRERAYDALLGSDDKPIAPLDGPGGVVTGRRLATDGRVVAMGDDQGHVVVWDAASSTRRWEKTLAAAISRNSRAT